MRRQIGFNLDAGELAGPFRAADHRSRFHALRSDSGEVLLAY